LAELKGAYKKELEGVSYVVYFLSQRPGQCYSKNEFQVHGKYIWQLQIH